MLEKKKIKKTIKLNFPWVLTPPKFTPVSNFTEKETILNLQLLKSKIEKLTWVDSVITIIDVPLLKSTNEGLMDRLKNYKTLAYPEIDKKRGFEEIINSPIYQNYVDFDDGKNFYQKQY